MKKIISLLLLLFLIVPIAGCIKSKAVKTFDSKIEALGEITLDDEVAIKEAEADYEVLTDKDKKKANKAGLDDAKAKYQQLIYEKNAKEVVDIINGIGDVNAKNISKVKTARKKYDELHQDAKQKVTNYSKLEIAEKKAEEVRETEIARLKETCDISLDEMTGITWYHAKEQFNSTKFIMPYFGINGDESVLRSLFYYSGQSLVGFNSVIVMSDGEKYTKTFNVRDHSINIVTGQEWADIVATKEEIAMLKKIANSKETKVRYTGTFQDQFVVSEEDKQAIKDILALYDLLTLK